MQAADLRAEKRALIPMALLFAVLQRGKAGFCFESLTEIGNAAEAAFFTDPGDGFAGLCQSVPGHNDPGVQDILHHRHTQLQLKLPAKMIFADTDGGTNLLIAAFGEKATTLNYGARNIYYLENYSAILKETAWA